MHMSSVTGCDVHAYSTPSGHRSVRLRDSRGQIAEIGKALAGVGEALRVSLRVLQKPPWDCRSRGLKINFRYRKEEHCYKSSKHSAEDCSTCFNWVELITMEVKQETKVEN